MICSRPRNSGLAALLAFALLLAFPAGAVAWPTNTDRIHSLGASGSSTTVTRTWDNATDTGSPSSTMTFSAEFTIDDEPPGTPYDWSSESNYANVICREATTGASVVLWEHASVNSITKSFSFANSLPLAAVAHMNGGHGATCTVYAVPQDGINLPTPAQFASNYAGPTLTVTTNAPAGGGGSVGPPYLAPFRPKVARDNKTKLAVISNAYYAACPPGGTSCEVSGKLTAKYKVGKKQKTATFATIKQTVVTGVVEQLRVPLTRSGDKLFTKLKKLKFTLALTATGNGQTATARPTFTLRAPKAAKKKK